MKKSQIMYVGTLAILLGSSLGLVGCNKAAGGGTLTTQTGGKANVGFQMRCDNVGENGFVSGQFQWNDKGSDVKFHGVIDVPLVTLAAQLSACEDYEETIAAQFGNPALADEFSHWFGSYFGIVFNVPIPMGTYTPQPKNLGDGGNLSVTVVEAESSAGCNGVIVALSGGVYDGYYEGACLDHGNISVFGD